MKYVSIFSGIEAATVAWHPLGWEPLAFSEIDPFPSTVLQHHYPDIPNLGDITKIDWSPYVGAADIVVGGSPCQSFSVAGKREGLAGASGLMFEYIRAVRELRPRWFVWENVPGAFTSERGEAYRQLLSEMDALGYGLAWRVLDAQFFGVAQRRERVFLVGSLGTMRCAEVLFERESLSWDHQSSRQKRQALAEEAQGCVGEADHDSGCLTPGETQSRRVYPASGVYPTLSTREKSGQNQESVFTQFGDDIAGTLTARYDSSPCVDRGANVVVDERDKVFLCQTAQTGSNGKLVKQDDVMNTLDRTNSTAVAALDFNPTDARLRYAHDDVSQTLTARAGTGGNQVPLVQVQPVAFLYNQGSKARSLGLGEISPTLKTDHNPVVAFAQNQCDDSREQGDVAGALVVRQGAKQQTYICRADGQTNAMAGVNLAPTLTSHAKKDPPLIYPAEDSTGEDEPVTLQIRGGKPGGGKSALIQHDMSATLSTHNTRTLARIPRRLHRYPIPQQGTRARRRPVQGFRQQHGRTGHAMDWRTYSNGRRNRRNNRVDNRNRWIVAEEGATFLKKTIQR
ncbi:DNA cytosine methyltransferase [Bifidobacterium longum]|uniref:DNA cytosine methyltransferase n=1 Tax=Bifidobacterium longum TaxID=216816 RepID=UPI003C6C8750